MPQIIVTATVNDVEEWLKFKAEMVPAMSAVASDGASYVAADGSNQVASTWEVMTWMPSRQPRDPSLPNWRRRRSEPG